VILTKLFLTILCSSILVLGQFKSADKNYVIVIHGGAGTISKSKIPDYKQKEYEDKLTEALNRGKEVLESGGTALDCVEKVINVLEDSPLFNAGKGAVFTWEGRNELDASIMDGRTLMAGAVAGVRHIKNPISLARLVMEKSPHVLLAGEGAEEFAEENLISLVDTSYFFTQSRWDALQRIKAKKKAEGEDKHGTVGCVVLDSYGNLAAGTSTGGMTNKRWNRIGDSPIIGAGTYADNNTCAVSCTGHGEYFIRNSVAFDMSARMAYKHDSVQKAADEIIMHKLVKQGAGGGLIAVDKDGNIAISFNTEGMFRGYLKQGFTPVVKMFKN
jgi:beta-aspartyl-peptidase (threonine type)